MKTATSKTSEEDSRVENTSKTKDNVSKGKDAGETNRGHSIRFLLFLALLASTVLNIILLSGCLSVSMSREFKNPPPLFSEGKDYAEKFADQLKDDPSEQMKFNQGLKFSEEAQGKIVILLPDTEEIRNAKRIMVKFEDNSSQQ